MKALYWIGVVALINTGIFIILQFGVKPKPVGVMKPSFFSTPEEIGTVVYRRFYAPIEEKKLVVFGIPPQPAWHQDIVRGFLKTAAAEQRPFDLIIMESQMPPLDLTGLPPAEILKVETNSPTQAELADMLQFAKEKHKRTLVYTAAVFSTHLLKANPINRFEKMTNQPLFTITSAPLVLRQDQEFLVDPPCVGTERDTMGTSELGCAIMAAGRSLYRKNIEQDRFVSIMQGSPTSDDYLLMVSYPGQDKAGTKEDNDAYRMKPPGALGARGLPTRFDPDTLPPAKGTPAL